MNEKVNQNSDEVVACQIINQNELFENIEINKKQELIIQPEQTENLFKNMKSNMERHTNIERKDIKNNDKILQFFKFLLISLKIEIINIEFLLLIKKSSNTEIIICLISIINYINDNNGRFYFLFVCLKFFHIIRGIIGLFLLTRIPKTYNLIEKLNVDDNTLETKEYKEIVIDIIKSDVIPQIDNIKGTLFIYFFLTILNFFIDFIESLFYLSQISSNLQGKKFNLLIYLTITFINIFVDISYFIWNDSLKYSFPREIINLINQSYLGVLNIMKSKFKFFGIKINNDLSEKKEKENNENNPKIRESNK